MGAAAVVVPRPLAAPEAARLATARLCAVDQAPYFAVALFWVTPVAAPGLGTFAVDRHWRLYVDPAALDAWGPTSAGAVLVHEVGHLLRDHAERFGVLGEGADHRTWNVSCFPAGTLLPGGRSIESVATLSRVVDEDLVVVRTQAGEVAATAEHPFWTRRRRHKVGLTPVVLRPPEWAEASTLRVGNFVCVPRLADRRADAKIDLRGYAAQGTDRLGRHTLGNRAVKSIPLDADTAWLVGLYVAEGSSSPRVRFSLGAHEAHLADRIAKIVEKLGWSAARSVRGTSMHVTLGAVVLGRWLKEHCGPRATAKRIPDVILRHSDPAVRAAFVEGLVDGDGYRSARGNRRCWSVSTSSEPLMRDLVLLLAQDGVGCYTSVAAQRPRRINGVAMPDGTLCRVTWNPDGPTVSTRTLNGREVPSTNHLWKADDHGVWYPIRRLGARRHSGPVYNLTTPSHTYVANGYLVHNCDAALNDDLLAAGLPLPAGVVTPAALGLAPGGIEEVYYAALRSATPTPSAALPSSFPQGDPGGEDDAGAEAGGPGGAHDGGSGDDDGCGSGAGGPARSWEVPASSPDFPATDPAEADVTRRLVAADVVAHAEGHKGRGAVPAGLVRWAKGRLAPPTVPWQAVLRAQVRRALASKAGSGLPTYRRLSRRRVPDVVLPGARRPRPRVAVVVATSGSMSAAELTEAVSEVQGVARATGAWGRDLVLFGVDAAASAPVEVRRVSDVVLTGGGGTDMRVGIAAAEEVGADVVVVLSDAMTPWPDVPTRARLVVCVTSQGTTAGIPDWALTVKMGAPAPAEAVA